MPFVFRKYLNRRPGLQALYKWMYILLLWFILQAAFAIDQLGLKLDRIEYNNISADNIAIDLISGTGESVTLRISAGQLSLPYSTVLKQLLIQCPSGSLTVTTLRCSKGDFEVQHPDQGKISGQIELSYQLDGSSGQIAISNMTISEYNIAGSMAFDNRGWSVAIRGNQLDVSWLRKIIEPYEIWPKDYSDESGNVDVDVTVTGSELQIQKMQGMIGMHDLGFYGANAAEDLSGEITFEIDIKDGWQIKSEGTLAAGSVYVEPGITMENLRPGIALEVTEQPLQFKVDIELDNPLQQFNVRRFEFDQPGVMTANINANVTLSEATQIHSAAVSLTSSDAGQLYNTWLQPFLLNTQFNMLEAAGDFKTEFQILNNEIRHLDMRFDDIHVYDGNDRFHIAGLDGSFIINETAQPEMSGLSWKGAGIYRLNIGAGKIALESGNLAMNIVDWEDVLVLDGVLHIDALNIINAGKPDMTVTLDGALTPIDMTNFTQAMGLPIMSGNLTGTIKGLTYHRGNLAVEGQIDIGVFDGQVVVRNLNIEDLFGLVPVLRADIDIQTLDLELLTGQFSFGKIQGRLSGKVHNLELQAWQPVYFEAELATPADDTSRHRISQQAVDNLGYIGGGSINALSSGFLSIFKEYSYGRLGIGCRLYNGVCELSGVTDTEDGFIIVSRGGLLPPWIEVKGTGHSITWTSLVEGLRTITTRRPEFR